MGEPSVRVEVIPIDPGGYRQIAPDRLATELLRSRADDIKAAIQEATAIICGGIDGATPKEGWQLTGLEATFGLTLTAESGVIVAKASAEASFEVKLILERKS
jgi:NTP-dependent ternary system trypsin peptidase co-occuring protein